MLMRTYLRKFSALAIKLQKPAQSYHFFLHIIMCVPKFFINTLICIILSLLCFMYFLYILFVVFIAGKRPATAIPTCSFGGGDTLIPGHTGSCPTYQFFGNIN